MHMSRNKISILKSTPWFTFVLPCYENSYPYAPLHPICFDIPDPRASLSVRDYLRVHLKTQSRLSAPRFQVQLKFYSIFCATVVQKQKKASSVAYYKSVSKVVWKKGTTFNIFIRWLFITDIYCKLSSREIKFNINILLAQIKLSPLNNIELLNGLTIWLPPLVKTIL